MNHIDFDIEETLEVSQMPIWLLDLDEYDEYESSKDAFCNPCFPIPFLYDGSVGITDAFDNPVAIGEDKGTVALFIPRAGVPLRTPLQFNTLPSIVVYYFI